MSGAGGPTLALRQSTETDGSEHKPCPFCGGRDELEPYDYPAADSGKAIHQITCESCDAWGPEAETEAQAWLLWDKRPATGAEEGGDE